MVTGREETASTLQLDFAMAERLDLSYIGPDGSEHRPLILHRAPLGTHERFVALLIERFGGAFPTWLAPIQARVLPVGEAYDDYAREVQRELRAERIRCDVDLSGPTVLVLGGERAWFPRQSGPGPCPRCDSQLDAPNVTSLELLRVTAFVVSGVFCVLAKPGSFKSW